MGANKSKNDGEMMRVFEKVYKTLTIKGIKPTFHVMDNEASSTVMSWLERNNMDAQKIFRITIKLTYQRE